MNNPFNTFAIQNSLNEYPLSLSIQVSFGNFKDQNLECPCLDLVLNQKEFNNGCRSGYIFNARDKILARNGNQSYNNSKSNEKQTKTNI